VKSRRHSSASCKNERGGDAGKGAPFFAVGGFVGRGWVCRLWWSVFRGAGSGVFLEVSWGVASGLA